MGTFPYSTQSRVEYAPTDESGSQRVRTRQGENSSDGDEQDEYLEQTVRHTRDAVLLVSQRTSSDDPDLAFSPAEPVTLFVLDDARTEAWNWTITSESGRTRITVEGRITGTDRVTVAGEDTDCLVVTSRTTINHPDGELQQDRRTWIAIDQRIVVREETRSEGEASFNGVPVSGTAEDVRSLRSLDPG